jgi:hypothetical protein
MRREAHAIRIAVTHSDLVAKVQRQCEAARARIYLNLARNQAGNVAAMAGEP